jgi:hypothetical protein
VAVGPAHLRGPDLATFTGSFHLQEDAGLFCHSARHPLGIEPLRTREGVAGMGHAYEAPRAGAFSHASRLSFSNAASQSGSVSARW